MSVGKKECVGKTVGGNYLMRRLDWAWDISEGL